MTEENSESKRAPDIGARPDGDPAQAVEERAPSAHPSSLSPPAAGQGTEAPGTSSTRSDLEPPVDERGSVHTVPQDLASRGSEVPTPYPSRHGFDVIFTGGVFREYTVDAVKRNLVDIFGIDQSRVDMLFVGGEVVVKTNADRKTASDYIRACEEAGAVCRMEAHPARLEAPISQPPPRAPSAPPSRSPAAAPRFQPRLISPSLGPSNARYTPIKCLRINRPERGLEFLGPLGREERPVEDLLLISVFDNTYDEQRELQMLCFVKGIRRPYLVNAAAVQFKDFPAVLGQGLVTSLRNLVRLLVTINPRMVLDRETYEFLQGGQPQELNKDPVILATALGTALEEEEQVSEKDSLILSVKR